MSGSNPQEMVRVNVYSPTGGQHLVYHSGVEVFGTEYLFGGGGATGATGVSLQKPKVPPPGSGWTLYQSVDVAPLQQSRGEVENVLRELKVEFSSGSYDLVSKNCNHFSEAFCQRLCGTGIPSWVNAAASVGNSLGIGNLIRNAMGQSAPSAGGKADVGAGGLGSAGMMTGTVGSDGDLSGEVDWSQAGVGNAQGDDPANALRSGGSVTSEDDAELLFELPFRSLVKLQALHLTAASVDEAPTCVRLFANERNLVMTDAAGEVAPTQAFGPVQWSEPGPDGAVTAALEVKFLKFQNLGYLAVYVCREDEEGLAVQDGEKVCIRSLRLVGKA